MQKKNAEIIRGVLSGKLTGPKRDIVLVNSAAALYIAGKTSTIEGGLTLAARTIDTLAAFSKLEAYREVSNRYREVSA